MSVGSNPDVNVINPFITSIINVFHTMVQMEIKRTSLSVKKNDKVFGDITAIIGLAGAGSGNVVISFQAPLARTLVAKMLGCETNTLSKPDIKDGIGEIVNMVAGSAKSAFSDTKYKFSISLPTVVEGDPANLEIGHKTNVPCIEVGFETPDKSKFVLEVSLQCKVEE